MDRGEREVIGERIKVFTFSADYHNGYSLGYDRGFAQAKTWIKKNKKLKEEIQELKDTITACNVLTGKEAKAFVMKAKERASK